MTKHTIAIEFDDTHLHAYEDSYLATLWHVAQANPAEYGDPIAGDLTEHIGREIIRRWLKDVPADLWHHQGHSYYWKELTRFAKYIPGDGPTGSPEWKHGTWVPRKDQDNPSVSGGAS